MTGAPHDQQCRRGHLGRPRPDLPRRLPRHCGDHHGAGRRTPPSAVRRGGRPADRPARPAAGRLPQRRPPARRLHRARRPARGRRDRRRLGPHPGPDRSDAHRRHPARQRRLQRGRPADPGEVRTGRPVGGRRDQPAARGPGTLRPGRHRRATPHRPALGAGRLRAARARRAPVLRRRGRRPAGRLPGAVDDPGPRDHDGPADDGADPDPGREGRTAAATRPARPPRPGQQPRLGHVRRDGRGDGCRALRRLHAVRGRPGVRRRRGDPEGERVRFVRRWQRQLVQQQFVLLRRGRAAAGAAVEAGAADEHRRLRGGHRLAAGDRRVRRRPAGAAVRRGGRRIGARSRPACPPGSARYGTAASPSYRTG